MKPYLYLLSGCPASGKSTFAKKYFGNKDDTVYISRDEIRFEFLGEDEEYFAHEEEVLEIFYWRINEALHQGKRVIMDATHNTIRARYQALKNINQECLIIPINFEISLSTLLERNAQRVGRECVPEVVIKRMYKQRQPATYNEEFKYHYIINVDERIEN